MMIIHNDYVKKKISLLNHHQIAKIVESFSIFLAIFFLYFSSSHSDGVSENVISIELCGRVFEKSYLTIHVCAEKYLVVTSVPSSLNLLNNFSNLQLLKISSVYYYYYLPPIGINTIFYPFFVFNQLF